MARLPTRKSLQLMKRVDLQKICKDYGVRANLKSEALIDLLLETQSPPIPQPTRRSVSTRQSSRQGPSRVTSMIVHDIDEEDLNLNTEEAQQDPSLTSPAPTRTSPAPRTRKAKETQTRLGVGRPIAAGGQGPRAVTRSSGSRGKEAKSSKSHKPKEPTIQEELEVVNIPTDVGSADEEHREQQNDEHLPTLDNKVFDLNSIVENAVRPLHDQIKALRLELEQMRAIKVDVTELQLKNTKFEAQSESLNTLSASVISLKDEMKQIRDNLAANSIPSRPSTPIAQRVPKQPPIAFAMSSLLRPPLPAQVATPLQTQSTSLSGLVMPTKLGKRRRANNTLNVVEEGEEAEYSDAELASSVVGPIKKRPRIVRDGEDSDNAGSASSSHSPSLSQDIQQAGASNSDHGVPAFTIFTDPEEPSDYLDPPPPTNHLPDFFQPHSPSSSNLALHETKLTTTTTANATENQPQGFNFSFLPMSSTPLNAMYMPSFPYPEPPLSPSPAGANMSFPSRHTEERTDIFKELGFPSPIRLSRSFGVLPGSHQEERGGFVNPAALTQQGSSGRQREVSSNEVAAGLGLTAVRTLPTSETASLQDHPPTKRTMYGTELDVNTRFGDFGVEGVATGFWSAGK